MKKVYIASSYKDLKEHPSAVTHALRMMGYEAFSSFIWANPYGPRRDQTCPGSVGLRILVYN
jgi:hypothetical protein